MRNKLILFCGMMCLALTLSAQTQSKEAIRAKINKAAQEMRTMQCDFTQTKYSKMLNDQMVSKGRMCYKQKNMLRWEYVSPYTYTFILNDTQVLLKNEHRNDVIDTKQNKMFKEIARIMMNSVIGKCLDDKEYKVELFPEAGEWVARLTPLKKNMKQMFQKIILHFDMKKAWVTKVELQEKKGDRTVIVLKNVRTNHEIDNKMFSVR